MLGNSADCWQCTLLSISVSAAQLAQSHRHPCASSSPLSAIAIHMGFGSPQPNCESCIFDELFAMQFAGQVKFLRKFFGLRLLPRTARNRHKQNRWPNKIRQNGENFQ